MAVKIGRNKNIWMNHIKIHISFEKHNSIIEFVGFCYTDRTFGILLKNAEYDLLYAIKMDKYDNDKIFFEFFIKRIVEIINGMVCYLEIVNRFNRLRHSSSDIFN